MSKRGRSEYPKNATDAQLEEFYNNSSNGKESGLYYDPFTKSYKPMFRKSGGVLVKVDKYEKFLTKMKQGNESQVRRAEDLSNKTEQMRQRIMEAKNPRIYYKNLRDNFIENERLIDENVKMEEDSYKKRKVENLGGRDQKKVQKKYGGMAEKTSMDVDNNSGGAGESKEPDDRENEKRSKYPTQEREDRYNKMRKRKNKKRQKQLENRRKKADTESKYSEDTIDIDTDEDEDTNEGGAGESKVADEGEVPLVPGADPGNNVRLDVQEAKVDGGGGGGGPEPDLPRRNPRFGPEDRRPPPPVPNFEPGPPIPIAPVRPMPDGPPDGPVPPMAQPAVPAPPPAAPAAPAGPLPAGPPGGGLPAGPPGGGPPGGGPPGGGPPNPAAQDPQLVEVNRGVPGEIGGQMGFTSSAATRVAGERNRMKYSRERLINEIRAFIRIYRDQIKTRSFLSLAKVAKNLTKNSPAVRLRQVHRDLEEEIIDYYRTASGMRVGVILDPGAIGLNVNQLQAALAPNLAFGGQGEVVRNLANAADAGRPNNPVQRAVDTHYHLGGLAHATKATLPETRNLQSNDRPAERIQLLRGRTRKIKVPQEATRRFLWQDTRRPIIPKNIKIKSVKD